MLKSVFSKYITVLSLIIFVSFLLLSSIIASIINEYAWDEKTSDLKRTSEWAAAVLNFGFSESTEDAPDDFLEHMNREAWLRVERYAKEREGLSVFLTAPDGRVLFFSQEMDGLVPDIVDVDILKNIAILQAQDDMSVMTNEVQAVLGGKELVCARAVTYDRPDGRGILGYVFVCTTDVETGGVISNTNQTILISCLWVMLAMLVAVYFITERVLEPVRRMSRAAQNYAKGDFATRIEVVGQDEITELANAFNHMADSLEHLEKMRNSFLANVSHDLRTPMTSIAGFIDGIREGAIPPEKQPYYLDLIDTEIHRLSRLVSSILDISRLDSGERKFRFDKCDLCETARLVLISFEQRIEEKKLQIGFETDEDAMYTLADGDALHQVIYNLCENALKFSYEGGALRIGVAYEEGDMLRLTVYNEGSGIPEEDLPFVFERFYKSDKSRGLDKTGVGLGLSIVRGIIEAHSGSISVQSEAGKYCQFTVLLPRYRKPNA